MFEWLRKVFAAFTGVFLKKNEKLNENEHVVRATFDRAQAKSKDRIITIKNAVGKLIANREAKLQQIKDLEEECATLEKAKRGAEGMARKRKDELVKQGLSKEQIQADPEFIKCATGHRDAESTLKEKRARIASLEQDIDDSQSLIADHQSQLQILQADLQKLHEEESEHIADLESNKALEEASSTLAGIANDNVNNDLAEIRKARRNVAGRAKATQELAGTDNKVATDAFLEFASNEEAASEFDSLMDWDEDATDKTTERESSQLPE